jgi:hypothetical protein
MKKLFHFDAPRDRYVSDAAIVWCFDNRFDLGFRKFLQRIGIEHPDPIKIAGGAKSLASPGQESDRQFVLDQIRSSMKLHGTKRVILMLHSDCGAYGGLEAFHGDEKAEFQNHRRELHHAAATLKAAIPGIEVDVYFVNFEGIWTTEAEPGSLDV